jgi:hypothetical protein
MRPEWALPGTLTTNPSEDLLNRALGELRAMRAPGLRGNATTMPLLRFEPCRASRPRSDTTCGLVEQWLAGTHETPEISTCDERVTLVLLGCLAVLPTGVPPELPGPVGGPVGPAAPPLAAALPLVACAPLAHAPHTPSVSAVSEASQRGDARSLDRL